MSESIRLKGIEKMRANQPMPYPDGPTLLPCQSETLNRFDDEGVASNEIRMSGTRYGHLSNLRLLGLQFPKPYIELTEKDLRKFFSQKIKGKFPVVPRSLYDYVSPSESNRTAAQR